MQASTKTLVVGTTPDYVDWLRHSCPGKGLFLTDLDLRRVSQYPSPSPREEILCDLSDYELVTRVLKCHLKSEGLTLDGVASYDCESMELAAVIAGKYSLPYPSVQAINNCRNKYISKTIWQKNSLPTPKARVVKSANEAAVFQKELGVNCVLKPLSGSGSELIYSCKNESQCKQNFRKIKNGLLLRRGHRLYKLLSTDHPLILSEECIGGTEYSCDFIRDNGHSTIIRLTKKIIAPETYFGTALGYLLEPSFPDEIDEYEFRYILDKCAEVLGLGRAFCMLDFLVDRGRIVLLELTPRPGGDCLPFLLRHALKLDILKLFLDFSSRIPLSLPLPCTDSPVLALRIHASKSGVLRRVDTEQIKRNPRVREIHLIHGPGDIIKLPPEDYDSWVLGHIIFEPDPEIDVAAQCHSLVEELVIEVE